MPPSCQSNRIEAFAWRQSPTPTEREECQIHLSDASKEGYSSHGCHRRRLGQSRARFHLSIAHLHTTKELASTVHVASHRRHRSTCRSSCIAEDQRPTTRQGNRGHTSTPSLHEGPQPTSTSGQVQDCPQRPSPTPRDELATIRPASPRRNPRPASPGKHRRSPRRTGMTESSLLARLHLDRAIAAPPPTCP